MSVLNIPDPPELRLSSAPGEFSVEGWKDLDLWGMLHNPAWKAIRMRTRWLYGVSEDAKLRLLAGEMLRINHELLKQNQGLLCRFPAPRIIFRADQLHLDTHEEGAAGAGNGTGGADLPEKP
jgi:hypothetical protein